MTTEAHQKASGDWAEICEKHPEMKEEYGELFGAALLSAFQAVHKSDDIVDTKASCPGCKCDGQCTTQQQFRECTNSKSMNQEDGR